MLAGGLALFADGKTRVAASAVVCAGQQTATQLLLQTFAAACGASASAGAEPLRIAEMAGLDPPIASNGGIFNPSCRMFRVLDCEAAGG